MQWYAYYNLTGFLIGIPILSLRQCYAYSNLKCLRHFDFLSYYNVIVFQFLFKYLIFSYYNSMSIQYLGIKVFGFRIQTN